MRFSEIGQQLRTYRLESGLRAEEIAARLGVSRAALYRYEKGDVIKLDTIKRLAELLKISPLALLGIGVEYFNRPAGFSERIRQIEETADQILQVHGAISYLNTSDAYDATLGAAFNELAEAAQDRAGQRAVADQLLGILADRKRQYVVRRPGIIAMVSTFAIQRFLQLGVAGALPLSERLRRIGREVAATEIENVARIMESAPMGLQFGLLPEPAEYGGGFIVFRARDRASVAINPFQPDLPPQAASAVALVTGADEALAAHQRVAEANWRDAIKGATGAARVRELLAAVRQQVTA
jgi:transcriptional regulator with XRE-family HTH domain